MIEDRAPRLAFRNQGGHLPLGAVVDGVRGVASLPSMRLSRHLDACARCRARFTTWNGFVVLAGRESRLLVPEAALDRVRTLARPRPGATPFAVIASRRGLQRGGRGGHARRRAPDQFVYEAEGVAVDLRVSGNGAEDVVIVGQVARAGQPDRRVGDLPVVLLDGEDVKIRALSDARGEFHLAPPRCRRPRIEVGLPGGRIVRIPLAEIETRAGLKSGARRTRGATPPKPARRTR
jgi:hypothetical protein